MLHIITCSLAMIFININVVQFVRYPTGAVIVYMLIEWPPGYYIVCTYMYCTIYTIRHEHVHIFSPIRAQRAPHPSYTIIDTCPSRLRMLCIILTCITSTTTSSSPIPQQTSTRGDTCAGTTRLSIVYLCMCVCTTLFIILSSARERTYTTRGRGRTRSRWREARFALTLREWRGVVWWVCSM